MQYSYNSGNVQRWRHEDNILTCMVRTQWHYLAIVTKGDSADNGGYIYFDGISQRYELTNTIDGKLDGNGKLQLNGEGDVFEIQQLYTYVDELTFWNRALSPDEVKILYNLNLRLQCFN